MFKSDLVRLMVSAALVTAVVFAAIPVSADTAGRKALRGLANIGCGYLAIPGEMSSYWEKDGPAMAWSAGLGVGLGMFVARELMGVFELLTSPAPWPSRRGPRRPG